MFNESFKYYKSKCPPPDLKDLVDFQSVSNGIGKKQFLVENDLDCEKFGLKPSNEWRAFGFDSHPGFIVLQNPFTPRGQRYWIARCLRDFSKSNHVNIPESKYSREVIKDWWKALHQIEDIPKKQKLKEALRWATLGYHHDWDTKVYTERKRDSFPVDLGQLTTTLAKALGWADYRAEAAIINYYPIGSTLAGHTDHSEQDLEAPLFSLSFGQSAIFLLGGRTKETKPTAFCLRSGDVAVMAKESRLCYHAVPKIISSPDANEAWQHIGEQQTVKRLRTECDKSMDAELWDNCSADHSSWSPFNDYISDCRINLNVRQVLVAGEKSLPPEKEGS